MATAKLGQQTEQEKNEAFKNLPEGMQTAMGAAFSEMFTKMMSSELQKLGIKVDPQNSCSGKKNGKAKLVVNTDSLKDTLEEVFSKAEEKFADVFSAAKDALDKANDDLSEVFENLKKEVLETFED